MFENVKTIFNFKYLTNLTLFYLLKNKFKLANFTTLFVHLVWTLFNTKYIFYKKIVKVNYVLFGDLNTLLNFCIIIFEVVISYQNILLIIPL